jgi:hypothetical protein
MSLGRYRLRGEAQQKIRAEHLGRAAVVYVRQSSRQQVLEHTESTRLQYALAERAAALGWARSQVMVIDDDLGVSAATADSRKGFARLVTEVTMGRVGIVLGIEMSRLARTGRDWHQLLELCSLSGVLLADPDGVYDPGFYNDRLLLGLSDPGQLLRCEWPGHLVDDASLTWRRRGRRAAGSVAGSGVPGVPAQREQLAVSGRELGLGFGQFAAQLSEPGSEGGDHAVGVAGGFTRRSMPGGCGLVAAEPFDAGTQPGVAVEEVHRHAAGRGDRAECDGLAGLGERAYPGFGAGGSGIAFGGRGLAQRGDPVLLSRHARDPAASCRS